MRHLYHRHRHVVLQFSRYILSGGTAAFMELASFNVMLWLDVHYLQASIISSGVGIMTAFLLHKFFVFKKREQTTTQAIKFALLTTWNIIAQTFIVFALVEWADIHPTIAKILGIGSVVSWNFFMYKFVVYK